MNTLRFPVAALIAVITPACSFSPGARILAGYTQTKVSGDLALESSTGGVNSKIDVQDDLGLDGASGSLYGRVELDAGLVRYTGSIFQYDETGSGVLSGDFGDISGSTPVDSALKILNFKNALSFDVIDTDVYRLSPGVQVSVLDMDARVTDLLTGITEDVSGVVPLPLLFLQQELTFDPVSLVLDAGAMSLTIDGTKGTMVDLEGLVMVSPWDVLELFAGYRWIYLELDGDVDDQLFQADLVQQGWVLGGGVTF